MDDAVAVCVFESVGDLSAIANDASRGRPSAGMSSESGWPSTYSMTMYAWPSISPVSYTVQMCGWFRPTKPGLLQRFSHDRQGCDGIAADQLDRDGALQLFVMGTVYRAHSTGAEPRRNPEVAESLSNHGPGPSEEL